MIVGGYSLHLYCDCEGHINDYERAQQAGRQTWEQNSHDIGEFTGHSRAECVKAARSDGWVIDITSGRCKCPTCAKAKRKYSPEGY